jgi:hypothetical protein
VLGTAPDTAAGAGGAGGAEGAEGADVEKTVPEGGAAGMSLADVGRGRKREGEEPGRRRRRPSRREGEELGRANAMEEEAPISAPDDLWGEDDWSWLCEGEGVEVWWCGVIRAEGGPG